MIFLFFRRLWGVVLAVGLLPACGASNAELRDAHDSLYRADFAIVYSEAIAAVTELYPQVGDNVSSGVIQTAWHVVAVQSDSFGSQRPVNIAGNSSGSRGAGSIRAANSINRTTPADRKRYFVRMRVHILGGSPWRVRVTGEASVLSAGDVPLPLKGAEIPPWLQGRSDALQVAIYRRLKKFAVQVDETESKAVVKMADRAAVFGQVPKAAQEVMETLIAAVNSRQFAEIRPHLAPKVRWSAGNQGSADVAMAMWQADPSLLTRLVETMNAGCVVTSAGTSIRCASSNEGAGDAGGESQAIFEKQGPTWVLAAFWGGQP